MSATAAPFDLAQLRARVRALECGARDPVVRPLGLGPIDRHLGGGLPVAQLHEVLGETAPAAAFAFHLAARLASAAGPLLWITGGRDLHGVGLAQSGIDPRRVMIVRAERVADRLWALEEALRTPGVAAALAELPIPDLIAARRLQLAAEAGGATALVLPGAVSGAGVSIAASRWRVQAAPSAEHPLDRQAPGRARWRLDLVRARHAPPASWMMEADDDGGFAHAQPHPHASAHSVAGAAHALDRPAEAA